MSGAAIRTVLGTAALLLAAAAPVAAQGGDGDPNLRMDFEAYQPVSTLVVPEHRPTRASFPFIDIHAHLRNGADEAQSASYVADMDAMNMAIAVNLSGRSGAELKEGINNLAERHPGRIVLFANVDFDGMDEPDWTARTVARFEEDVRNGARGLKIFKNLGMYVEDANGRVATSDPRIDPIWAKAGELGVPVLIHTGDPAPFWSPRDSLNERWLELKQRPRRMRPPEPSFEQIMGEHWDMIRKHPETNFISAHMSWLANDLGRLGQLLDELPNMYVELGAVLAEIGRQPRAARAFLIEYQDRVLFGKDSWAPEEYHVYFRVLETADEYFDYYRPRHAHWKIYGVDLPDEVLRKIYYENALRLVPGLDRSLFETADDGRP
jgi:predicted TIM-barrel fold metal-dependent hydrolase